MSKKLEKRLLCLSDLTNPEQEEKLVISVRVGKLEKMQAAKEDSLETQDTKSSYLGLRNLGSTCYLNSLIQCYYHMPEFRQLVYNLEVADEHPVKQLKLIFGQLQLNPEGPIDPSGLVAALGIKPGMQQDATEFHLLFMNCLEDRCPQILDLIRGTEAHETRCKMCGYLSQSTSKFFELEIRTAEKNFQDSLKNMLAEEVLEGSNQYHCPKCNKMQDGSRRTRLIHTPKYLTFHLMRFRMGVDSVRKKLSNRVYFPDFIDMTPYVSTDVLSGETKVEKSLKYVCFCIILHIGERATAGHYICLIRCREGSEEFWKVCNDECVFTIPLEDFNLSVFSTSIVSLDTYYSKLKKSPNRASKSGFLGSNGYGCGVLHGSTTAYMVIYRLTEGDDTIVSPGYVQVPDSLQQEIGAVSEQSLLEKRRLEDQKVREKALTKLRPDLRKSLLSHLRATKSPKVLPPKRLKSVSFGDSFDSDDDICLVPTRWLKKWIANPDSLPPQLTSSSIDEGKIFAIAGNTTFNLKPFLCRHNRISPTNSLESIRAVSRCGLEAAFDLSIDYEACSVVYKETTDSCFLNSESGDILSPCAKCVRQRVMDNRFNEECEIISKEMREWKRISKECTYPLDKSVYDNVRQDTFHEVSDEHPLVYFVGTKSLATWRSFAQNHYARSLVATESVPTDFNKDAVCAHGHLMKQFCRVVRPSIWRRIVALFNPPFSAVATNIDEYPSDTTKAIECSDCEADLCSLIKRAQDESESMSTVLNASDSISSSRDLNMLIEDVAKTNPQNTEIYLIPVDFIRKWRRFCRAPKTSDVSTCLPSGFECPSVRCEHNKLRMPWDELISENLLFPLSSREWALMSKAYPESKKYPPMCLARRKSHNGMKETEEGSAKLSLQFNLTNELFQVCSDCHEEIQLQRLNFRNSPLYIHPCLNPETAIELDAAETAALQNSAEGEGLRRSSRRHSNSSNIRVHVDGSTSLRSLRSMLIESLGAYPSDQHLLVNGLELTDNSKTLYQLGVRPNMVLFAWVDSPKLDESQANMPFDLSANVSDIEIGFSGTRLMEF
ncbi:hypothetical protein Aperf_G00000059965 [Anoplocephala perfoliata]